MAAWSTSWRSASDKEISKLALRACGTSCTLGELDGEVGEVECVFEEEERCLSIVDDRPDFESLDRGLEVCERDVVFWKAAMAN